MCNSVSKCETVKRCSIALAPETDLQNILSNSSSPSKYELINFVLHLYNTIFLSFGCQKYVVYGSPSIQNTSTNSEGPLLHWRTIKIVMEFQMNTYSLCRPAVLPVLRFWTWPLNNANINISILTANRSHLQFLHLHFLIWFSSLTDSWHDLQ